MPTELTKLKGTLERALSETADLWPDVKKGFGYVHQAAHILGNHDQGSAKTVRGRYRKLIQAIEQAIPRAGELRPGLEHFLQVTGSYQPGLFHCYDIPDLPRTNNALEQLFGSTRHHERRCTGRKVASPSLVLRGSVRIIAGLGTRERAYSADELAPRDLAAWRRVRAHLDQRRQTRVLRCRFRRDPAAFLAQLEDILLKLSLPS
jgi:hypothetical protein